MHENKKEDFKWKLANSKGFQRMKNLRADILRSISPRLSESAQIPDLTWKLPFWGAFDSDKDLPCKSVTELFLSRFSVGSKDDWSVWEVNVPRGLDPPKLFNGIAAKGSTKFTFDDPIFSDLVTGGATWSDAAKKSIVEETVAEGTGCAVAHTDCAANKSTFGCMFINN